MRTLVFICLAGGILNGEMLFAQSGYNLPPQSFYEKASIGMKNYDRKTVTKLNIMKDSIHFVSNNGDEVALSLKDINYIRVKEGNKAAMGALLGGASALALSVIISTNTYSYDENESALDAGAIVGITIGGTALGALIGKASSREKSYYVHIQPKPQTR